MTNAQNKNKHRRTKSNKKSTRAGKRAHTARLKHGRGKGLLANDKKNTKKRR